MSKPWETIVAWYSQGNRIILGFLGGAKRISSNSISIPGTSKPLTERPEARLHLRGHVVGHGGVWPADRAAGLRGTDAGDKRPKGERPSWICGLATFFLHPPPHLFFCDPPFLQFHPLFNGCCSFCFGGGRQTSGFQAVVHSCSLLFIAVRSCS